MANRERRERWIGITVLCLASAAFWKWRIIDTAHSWFSAANLDMFVGQQPMTHYAVDTLLSGRLPLWDPYQLCGEPFLAIPYVGIFYPFNFVYAIFPAPVGFELVFGLHMLFGAVGMWLLVRDWELPWLAAGIGALTFAWSGWPIHYANHPWLHAGLAWMPISVWAVERVIRGNRFAPFGLSLAIALQVFNGAVEILVHTLYVAGLYSLFRLGGQFAREPTGTVLRRGALLLVCVSGGFALAAVQLVPTLELVAQSARGPGELAIADTLKNGSIPLGRVLASAVANDQFATCGVLALVAVGLGWMQRERRVLWAFAVAAGGLALALAEGGWLYRLYFELPIGTLFRRPVKFLSIYSFAQALLCALAIGALWRCVRARRAVLWRQLGWWLGLACAFGVWWAVGGAPLYLVALIALLGVFGCVEGPRWRGATVGAIALLQVTSLFLGEHNRAYRPWHFPSFIADHGERIEAQRIAAHLERERLYIAPSVHLSKQGLVSRFGVVTDYEPMAPRRYGDYFAAAVGAANVRDPFNGRYSVDADSRWPLLDLAGTRLYLFPIEGMPHTEDVWIPTASDGFTDFGSPLYRVFERDSTLPRAYHSARARFVASEGDALAAIAAADFDPRRDLVLERGPSAGGTAGEAGIRAAEIVDYRPESVEIRVDAPRAGHLVLTDFDYPGWKATVNGAPAAILRANYLFRAVAVDAGVSRVRFDYEPGSFRLGAATSALAGCLWIGGWMVRARSTGRRPNPHPSEETR